MATPRSISELKPLAQPLQSSSLTLLGLLLVPNPPSPSQRAPGTAHTGTWPPPRGDFGHRGPAPAAHRCSPLVPRHPTWSGAHLIVVARAEEDVVGGGVPLHQADAPAVPVQLQDGLRHVPLQAALGDLPYPHLRDGVSVWGALETPSKPPSPTRRHIRGFQTGKHEEQPTPVAGCWRGCL